MKSSLMEGAQRRMFLVAAMSALRGSGVGFFIGVKRVKRHCLPS